MKRRKKNMLRSSLGGHYAGTGMAGTSAQEFDDLVRTRGIKVHRSGMLPSDNYIGDKKAFKKYCEDMSGEVITYKKGTKG